MNKKAWIKIFEAVIAILLITSVLLIVVNEKNTQKNEDSLEIYKEEIAILREIQLNTSLRNDILGIESFPVRWGDFNSAGLTCVKEEIISNIPDYLDCEAAVCNINDSCILEIDSEKPIYAQSVVISSNITKYSLRLLKLFCWKI